jgi:hypothetical protein
MRYSNWQAFAILQSRQRHIKPRLVSCSVTTANNLAMYGLTARTSQLHVAWGHSPAQGMPAKDNMASILTCCNCKLVDRQEPHPSNYQGCRHAKEERCERESRRERPRLQWEECSLPATPLQGYPSRQCYAATHSNLSHSQLHRPAP